MKKTLRTLMMGMMALLGCTALTSCTNDDEPQVAQQEGQKGYVEFTLSRGADTRLAYEFNESTKGLDVTWSKDDKILVFYIENETAIVEQFGLVSGDGTTKATFAKSDSQLAEKSGELVLRYIPGFDETNYQTQVFDFSEQSGLLKDMANYDYFAFSADLTNGQISNPEYQAAMAVYHFNGDINFGVGDGNKDFVFDGDATTNSISLSKNTTGPITVKNVSLTGGKLSKDLYVVVYASHAPTTLTIGNQTFELPTDKLEAGKMYTFAQENLKEIIPLTIEPVSSDIEITIKNPLGLTIDFLVVNSDNTIDISSYSGDSSFTIPVKTGQRVQLFGKNKTYSKGSVGWSTIISCSDKSKVYGNIMSLIDSENFASATTLTDDYTFAGLFYSNTGLTDASGLLLPATTLAESCYTGMFNGCANLTTAPELPATTLAESCYAGMFIGCANLTTAPSLPATTLAVSCYQNMFYGCSNLTTAPVLPATTLAQSCYYKMFNSCTSLTTAPELPATTLALTCYYNMFKNCSNLKAVTCLAVNISATECTTDWLNGVAASGTFTKASSMMSWETGASGIPSGWTIANY